MALSPGCRWAAAPADRAASTLRTRASDGSRWKGFGRRRRAPRSCSENPHLIPVRGAPVPQSRAVHTPVSTTAISGASAVFRGFRPASLPTATTRDRGRLSLIETVRQQVLRGNDPSHAGPFLWRVRMQLARVGPTTPKQLGAMPQTCAQSVVHVPPDSSSAVRATEMGSRTLHREAIAPRPGGRRRTGVDRPSP
jgi:hypothetical protein